MHRPKIISRNIIFWDSSQKNLGKHGPVQALCALSLGSLGLCRFCKGCSKCNDSMIHVLIFLCCAFLWSWASEFLWMGFVFACMMWKWRTGFWFCGPDCFFENDLNFRCLNVHETVVFTVCLDCITAWKMKQKMYLYICDVTCPLGRPCGGRPYLSVYLSIYSCIYLFIVWDLFWIIQMHVEITDTL